MAKQIIDQGYSLDFSGKLVAIQVVKYNEADHSRCLVHPQSRLDWIDRIGVDHQPNYSVGAIGPNWAINAGDSFIPATIEQLREIGLINA